MACTHPQYRLLKLKKRSEESKDMKEDKEEEEEEEDSSQPSPARKGRESPKKKKRKIKIEGDDEFSLNLGYKNKLFKVKMQPLQVSSSKKEEHI